MTISPHRLRNPRCCCESPAPLRRLPGRRRGVNGPVGAPPPDPPTVFGTGQSPAGGSVGVGRAGAGFGGAGADWAGSGPAVDDGAGEGGAGAGDGVPRSVEVPSGSTTR